MRREACAIKRQPSLLPPKSVRAIEFVEDPEILGGCIIETDGGIIDATIKGKLNQLDNELGEAA